jgi:cytosine/creatinine deaminase
VPTKRRIARSRKKACERPQWPVRQDSIVDVTGRTHLQNEVSAVTDSEMLEIALAEARAGLAEGGIPIGAAVFDEHGRLLGSGHNRRVQQGDPSAHGETDAFRRAGRRRSYRTCTMVTTLAPCWYCSGLVRQFGFKRLIVGESITFQGGVAWLLQNGVDVVDLQSDTCRQLLAGYIREHPEVWNEDIGEESL